MDILNPLEKNAAGDSHGSHRNIETESPPSSPAESTVGGAEIPNVDSEAAHSSSGKPVGQSSAGDKQERGGLGIMIPGQRPDIQWDPDTGRVGGAESGISVETIPPKSKSPKSPSALRQRFGGMLNPFRKKKSPKTKGTEVLRRLQELDGQAKRTNQGESASSGLALKPAKATIENETGASSFPAESAMHGADAGSNLDNKDSPAQKLDFDIAEMEPTNLGSGALSASHCSESDAGVPANNSDAT